MCLGSTRVFVEQERVISIQKRKKSFFLLWKECLCVCVCVYVWMCDPLLPKTPKKERDPRQESVGRATNKQTNKQKGPVLFLKILRHRRGNSWQDNATTSAFLPSFAANLKGRKKRRKKKKADRRMVLEKRGTEWKKKKNRHRQRTRKYAALLYFCQSSRRSFWKRERHIERERCSFLEDSALPSEPLPSGTESDSIVFLFRG